MNILYTLGCPNCIALERELKGANIKFLEVRDKDTIIAAGIDKIPVLEVDGIRLDYQSAIKWVKDYKQRFNKETNNENK